MTMPGRNIVPAPRWEPYRYGLLAAATEINDGPRWEAGVVWESDLCVDGFVWEVACANPFTVTLTRTASAGQLAVSISPAGSYNVTIDGGAPAVLGANITVGAGTHTVVITEGGGLERSVTLQVDGSSAQGTAYSAQSQQTNNPAKTGLDTADYGTADPFVVGATLECSVVGAEGDRARKRLDIVHSKLIEQRFWEVQLVNQTPAATDVTGGTATDLVTAVGLLEEAMQGASGAIGVFHAPRKVESHASYRRQTHRDGSVLRTGLDTKWAFGAGYPNTDADGDPSPADQVTIFATGPVELRMSDPYPRMEQMEQFAGFNRVNNTNFEVQERSVLVARECPLFVALVDLGA